MSSAPEPPAGACPSDGRPVALTRTARGWSVVSPGGVQDAADLVEGLSLADLVAEEFGALTEPDRTARRSARGADRHRRGRRPGRRPGGRPGAHRRPARARAGRPRLHRARDRRPRRAARHQRARRLRVAAPRGPLARAGPSPSWPARSSTASPSTRTATATPTPRRPAGPAPASPSAAAPRPAPTARRPATASPPRTAGPDPAAAAHPARARRPPRRTARADAARARRHRAARRRRRPGRRPARRAWPPRSPSGCRRWAARPSSSRRPASTGRRRCGSSTAAPTPTPATPTGSTPGRSPARCWTRWAAAARAAYLPVLWDLATRPGGAGPPAGRCRTAGCCSCPGRCCRASGWPSTSSSTCGVAPAARRRLTPPEQAWELPAFDRYDDEVDPAALADAVVLADHPDRPALVLAGRSPAELAEREEWSGASRQLNSPASQRSMMCRAIDTGGGSARGPVAGAQLVAGEPAGLLDLVGVEAEGVGALGARDEARASATAGTATAGCRRSGRR